LICTSPGLKQNSETMTRKHLSLQKKGEESL